MEARRLEERMDELARLYAENHDPALKTELEELSHRHAALKVAAALAVPFNGAGTKTCAHLRFSMR